MILRRRSAAVLLLGTLALTACKATGPVTAGATPGPVDAPSDATSDPTSDPTVNPAADPASDAPAADNPDAGGTAAGPKATSSKHPSPASTTSTRSSSPAPSGPRIVSFKVVRKPKCAEGTAVFRADPVDLIISWKITGADGAALSVDDPTHTPGTYGSEPLEGTESFGFSCAGPTGTVETHTYAIYTVGGGTQKSKTLKVSAKVLDKGLGNG